MREPRSLFTAASVLAFCICVTVLIGVYRSRYPGATREAEKRHSPERSTPGEIAPPASPRGAVSAQGEAFRRALDALPPIPPGRVDNPQAIEFLRLWAEIDPKAAIEYAAARIGLHGRAELAAELLIAWLNKAGDTPKAWVLALPVGELRSQLLPTIISGLAAAQPREALRLAATLQDGHRQRALSALFAEWGGAAPETAAAEAAKLPTPGERNTALNQVARAWANRDLNAALAWAVRLPPDPELDRLDYTVGVMETVVEEWASREPRNAANYLASAHDIPLRNKLLGLVATQWGDQNFEASLQWAANLPAEGDRKIVLRGVLSTVAEADMQDAANLALALPDHSRRQSIEFILNQWLARDQASVALWANSHSDGQVNSETVAAIVVAWASVNPESTQRWLDTLPTGPARDAGRAALADDLAARPTNERSSDLK